MKTEMHNKVEKFIQAVVDAVAYATELDARLPTVPSFDSSALESDDATARRMAERAVWQWRIYLESVRADYAATSKCLETHWSTINSLFDDEINQLVFQAIATQTRPIAYHETDFLSASEAVTGMLGDLKFASEDILCNIDLVLHSRLETCQQYDQVAMNLMRFHPEDESGCRLIDATDWTVADMRRLYNDAVREHAAMQQLVPLSNPVVADTREHEVRPSQHEMFCYHAYSAGEDYLAGKHGVCKPKQRQIYDVLRASLGNEIDVSSIPDYWQLPSTFPAFIKAYRRAKKLLSASEI